MWITWPPAASIRAAAAITSITMNGGTSLRLDAVKSRSGAVSQCRFKHRYLLFRPDRPDRNRNRCRHSVPKTSRIPRLVRAYPVIRPTANRQRLPMLLRHRARARKLLGLTARHGGGSAGLGAGRALAGAGEGKQGPADPARHRDRAIAARIYPADPARRRPGKAEHPGRHHQRSQFQRLRCRRPPHLRQLRRADAVGDARTS